MNNHPPSYYEDRAAAAEKLGKWAEAAQEWRNASGASLGHGRAERYMQQARRCDVKATIAPLTNHTAASVVRKTLTDGSYVYDVVLTNRECTDSIVLSPADEIAAHQLHASLITLGGCVDGGCNY